MAPEVNVKTHLLCRSKWKKIDDMLSSFSGRFDGHSFARRRKETRKKEETTPDAELRIPGEDVGLKGKLKQVVFCQ